MSRTSDVWLPGAREDFSGPALIDTHIWLWYLDGAADRISPDAAELLRRCTRGAGLRVSGISVWEIGNKAAKGKLTLMPSVSAWVDRAAGAAGLSFLPLTREVLLFSTQLPGTVHGDPADRMLIAAAALAGVPLITADRSILEYTGAAGGVVSAIDARP